MTRPGGDNMIGLGNDIQSVADFANAAALHEPDAVLTRREWLHCRGTKRPVQSMAGIFAAKEALLKALPHRPACFWTDMEIVHAEHGRPRFVFSGALAQWLESLELEALVSISHSGDYAHAVALVTARRDA